MDKTKPKPPAPPKAKKKKASDTASNTLPDTFAELPTGSLVDSPTITPLGNGGIQGSIHGDSIQDRLSANSSVEMLAYHFKPQGIKVTLHNGGVRAGWPSPAEDFSESIDLQELLIKHPEATFFVRARGDSMIGAGIYDGDILVVDRSQPWHNGVVGLCCIDGQFTVKKVRRKGSQIVLEACNEDYKPIELQGDSELILWGVVTWVLHQPN